MFDEGMDHLGTIWGKGHYLEQGYDYIMHTKNSRFYARNGSTGKQEFNDDDFSNLWDSVRAEYPHSAKLRPGLYPVTGSVKVPSGIIFRGGGWSRIGTTVTGTILKPVDGLTDYVIRSIHLSGVEAEVEYALEDFIIDGTNAVTGTPVGIRLANTVVVRLRNLEVYKMGGQGLFADGPNATTLYVDHCWFKDNALDQILLGTMFQTVFDRVVVEGGSTNYCAMKLNGPVSVLDLQRSYFESGWCAVWLELVQGGIVKGNYFNTFTVHGLVLTGSSEDIDVRKNTFNDIADRAISLDGSGHTIGPNRFTGTIGTKVSNQTYLATRFDGPQYQRSGSLTILNGETGVVGPHGLDGTPTVVHLTGRNSDTSQAICSNRDAVNIAIDVPAPVGGNRIVDWYAEYRPT
jgi:hypothetical protein